MRNLLRASLLIVTHATLVHAQGAIHEYRPEVIITGPRIHGIAAQVLRVQHLEMGDLTPNERIYGVGLNTATFRRVRLGMEARQLQTATAVEHRYIPTIYSTTPLPGGFESRNRARVEIRDLNRTWSQRWQNRSTIGRDVDVAGSAVFPYGQLDLSYDSRFRTINRIDKSIGVRIPISSTSSIDTFLTRQDDARRTPQVLLAAGALLRVAL